MEKDKHIWEAFQAGDEKAFETMFKMYYVELLRYGLKLTGEQELVKEWIQELFLKLWEKRKELKTVNSIKGYLLKSIRFRFVDHIRAKPRKSPMDLPYLSPTFSIQQEIIQKETNREKVQQLKRAIETLNPLQKEIIYLKFYNQLPYVEIAEVLEINYQTVRNYMSKALQILRTEIKK